MVVLVSHKHISHVYVKLITGLAKSLVPQTLTLGTLKDYSRIDGGVFHVTVSFVF